MDMVTFFEFRRRLCGFRAGSAISEHLLSLIQEILGLGRPQVNRVIAQIYSDPTFCQAQCAQCASPPAVQPTAPPSPPQPTGGDPVAYTPPPKEGVVCPKLGMRDKEVG